MENTAMFARRLFELAREMELEEARIKDAILTAANERDADRVRVIIERWRCLPVVEVLRGLEPRAEGSQQAEFTPP